MSLITSIPVSDFLQSANTGEARTNLGCASTSEILLSGNNVNQNFTVLWDSSDAEIYDITEIATGQFFGNTTRTGLSIGNSVTSIGLDAFYYCTGFTGNLVIPNSVTSIGSFAFYYCTGFTGNLVIPNSVTSIGSSAFSYCYGFTGDLVIGNSVTSIESSAFRNCSGFTGDLVIPNSVTSIGNFAFQGCSGFTGDLVIPNSVTSIGSSAFRNCLGFTGDLVIPNSVTTTGTSMFLNCTNLTNVNCYITKTLLDKTNNLAGTSITTIHALASDATWTAGTNQTIGGKTGITVIKDLT